MLTALDPHCPHATDLATLIDRAADTTAELPAGYEAALTLEQQAALRAVLVALSALVGTMAEPKCTTDFKAIPKPELRLRPPL